MILGDDIAITSKENFKERTLKGRLKHITNTKVVIKNGKQKSLPSKNRKNSCQNNMGSTECNE